jgi:hypothetical protein
MPIVMDRLYFGVTAWKCRAARSADNGAGTQRVERDPSTDPLSDPADGRFLALQRHLATADMTDGMVR